MRKMRPSCAALDGVVGNGARQHDGQWSIEQRHGAVAGVPLRRTIILGVDEHGHNEPAGRVLSARGPQRSNPERPSLLRLSV